MPQIDLSLDDLRLLHSLVCDHLGEVQKELEFAEWVQASYLIKYWAMDTNKVRILRDKLSTMQEIASCPTPDDKL
jgi:hypothetical protein